MAAVTSCENTLFFLDYFQELAKFSEYDKNNDPILWNNRIIRIERNGVFGNNGLIRVLLSIVI